MIGAGEGWLLAVDPGVNAGVAAFLNGKLARACLACAPEHRDKTRPDPDAIYLQARGIVDWFNTLRRCDTPSPLTHMIDFDRRLPLQIVFEWPKLYQLDRSSSKDYNDFLPLPALGLAVRSLLEARKSAAIFPAEWKGQLSGDDESVVRDRVLARLDTDERAAVELPRAKAKAHNVFDAIGIGLHALGRGLVNDRKRVYPR